MTTLEPAPASLWTAAEAASADRYSMDVLGVPSPVLMERAALCVSAEVEQIAASRGLRRVLVLVGPGNNGGDGLAVARQLHGRARLEVEVVLVTDRRNATTSEQLELARAHGVRFLDALPDRGATLDTVVVDALLGTGSQGPPRGAIERALRWLEGLAEPSQAKPNQGGPVVAVDVPSGVDVDSGAVASIAARATLTVTFQRNKVGLQLTPGRTHAGRVVVADIGLFAPPDARSEDIALTEPIWVAEQLQRLPSAAHKGSRGHVGVVGGTGGTPGAAVLAGTAALRAGAGLASLAMADESLRRALIELRPELMLSAPEDRFVTAADILVVGPGLTEGREGLTELDRCDARTMVWDASALDEFGGRGSAGPRVLTPHPGEAARLLARLDVSDVGWTSARVQADRRAAARRLVHLTEAVVVLKGAGTIVAAKVGRGDGIRLSVASTGGPALATAGSGDVLAGVIAALLARGMDAWAAACVGVHLHGMAGDGCPSDGTLALDVAERLPAALADAHRGQRPERWPRLRRG